MIDRPNKKSPTPRPRSSDEMSELPVGASFDVVVVGSGGAGLATAVFAALEGARVLVVESTPFVGGTTALSGGALWIPGTRQGLALNPGDSIDHARRYLDAVVGHRTSAALREAFLEHGAQAAARLEAQGRVRLRARRSQPDHQPWILGSAAAGRVLEPWPFDARVLARDDFDAIRAPMPEACFWGRTMLTRGDERHLAQWSRSLHSARHVASLLTRAARDRWRHGRGTRLVRGNALVAQLLAACRDLEVALLTRTRVAAMSRGNGPAAAVDQVTLVRDGATRHVAVHGGVVLASGGFNRHPMQRSARLPGIEPEWCPGAPGHTGTALALAEKLGAVFGTGSMSDCVWAPVSLRRRRRDGTQVVHAHEGSDHARQRYVAIDQNGQRRLDESMPTHAFALDMQDPAHRESSIPTYLVTDAQHLESRGLGMVGPHGRGRREALADGYLRQGATVRELAAALEVPAAALEAALADRLSEADRELSGATAGARARDSRNSRLARMRERLNIVPVGVPRALSSPPGQGSSGADAFAFARGTTSRVEVTDVHDVADDGETDPGSDSQGLPHLRARTPWRPPFYAVAVVPGDIAAATGLLTDERARVLDAQGRVIAGLHAVGCDMHSMMGGTDPAPGSMLGPAIVFASIAARHAAERARLVTSATNVTTNVAFSSPKLVQTPSRPATDKGAKQPDEGAAKAPAAVTPRS
jgi:glycine/D-amino acid oxidase-like deaminating enzyme